MPGPRSRAARARPWPPGAAGRRLQAGFTLVELVVVVVMVGVLAVFAAPAMLDMSAWRVRAYADTLSAEFAAMHRQAFSHRRPVVAWIDSSGVSFTDASGTLARWPCPPAVNPCIAQSGVRSVTFNAGNQGHTTTSTGEALLITLGSGPAQRRLQVETDTGLIRPAP